MGRKLKTDDQGASGEQHKRQLYCEKCGEMQFNTPSGETCKNSHGGVGSISAEEATKLRLALAQPVSEQLASEIKQADQEQRVAKHRVHFASANAAKKQPLRPDFVRVIEKIFVDDIEATYDRLIKALKLGEQRADYGSVIKALDEAESNAREAHSLYVTAVREREAYEKRNEVLFAGMRVEANKALQEEKDKGQRNKMITDADVNSMCALLFGDEWVIQERERNDAKRAEDSMKNLSDRWADRCRTLQSLAAKLR